MSAFCTTIIKKKVLVILKSIVSVFLQDFKGVNEINKIKIEFHSFELRTSSFYYSIFRTSVPFFL